MNEAAGYVEREAEQPEHEQQDDQRPKHELYLHLPGAAPPGAPSDSTFRGKLRASACVCRRSSIPLTLQAELLARVVLAAALGAALGLEREYRRKAAGLKTNALIAVGAALFTIVSILMVDDRGDPSRVAAQIVTGIGFLGGGAILRRGASVEGLTTAATIWVNAAVGMAAGAGWYVIAVGSTAVTLAVLLMLPHLERVIDQRTGSSQGPGGRLR